jgi:hypothetical protein
VYTASSLPPSPRSVDKLLIIGEKTPEKTFEIYVEEPTEANTIFDYWIIN